MKFNPQWTSADYSGEVPVSPKWSQEHFRLKGFFYYDEAISFTKESWRGRMRACRGVGAALSDAEVLRFDREHSQLLDQIVPDSFAILHRIDAAIYVPLS